MTRKQLAKQIAEFLFTAGNGERAERLVLTRKDGRDLGGWCQSAMADRIEKTLADEDVRLAEQSAKEGEGE